MTNELPGCELQHHNNEITARAKERLESADRLYYLAELFKIFGEGTRIKILYLLSAEDMCVCEIAQTLDMSISAVSHQLRVLKNANIVRYRREGKAVFYSLADSHVKLILDQGMEHIKE